MGLFGFGKKNKTEENQEILDVFEKRGKPTDQVKAPEQMTRKEMQQQADDNRLAEQKKQIIIDKLVFLRKTLYNLDGFDTYLDMVEGFINQLKNMKDNHDKKALTGINNLLLNNLDQAINNCNRKNFIGLGACLDITAEYIADRASCDPCYREPKFLDLTVQNNEYIISLRNSDFHMQKIMERGAILKAQFKDPKFAANQHIIKRDLLSLKAEREQLEKTTERLNATIESNKKILAKLRLEAILKNRPAGYDMTEVLEDTISTQKEMDAEQNAVNKLIDKLDEDNLNHSDSSLSIDDNFSTTVKQDDFNVDDLGF